MGRTAGSHRQRIHIGVCLGELLLRGFGGGLVGDGWQTCYDGGRRLLQLENVLAAAPAGLRPEQLEVGCGGGGKVVLERVEPGLVFFVVFHGSEEQRLRGE